MKTLLNKKSRITRAYNADVVPVQGGLALSPSDMLRSCNMGVPISAQLLDAANFDDGEVSCIKDVPFLLRRGVDVGDVVEYERNCRSKVSDVVKKMSDNA